ncbi:MAG: ornithine cyclodeaminase family protein [Candidatus Aminicenantes bacterium]|nr:ornithine cyclodeaminase family protein [Candidatus Aminicenantes bacterium]
MKIATLAQIKDVLPTLDLIPAIEEGFAAYSSGRATVPPVGELILDKGEVHIKSGFIEGEEFYVIKIASGFYGNRSIGLPSGNGCMLLFKQRTGEPAAILLDEGHLTDVRTAVAGAVAAKYCSPRKVERIGIVGAGVQARLQLEWLTRISTCRDVLVWGPLTEELENYERDMESRGFSVETTLDAAKILRTCNLVVTATPSKTPILLAADLRPGTHITAVGSDTPEKQELDPEILARADVIVADSLSQCRLRGEIHKALEAGRIKEDRCIELGAVISGREKGRTSESQITVVDLTGVAVQDIEIATAVYRALK